jgi:hypothetical protein
VKGALRLLMVEDSIADYHLTLRNLQKEGLEVVARRRVIGQEPDRLRP